MSKIDKHIQINILKNKYPLLFDDINLKSTNNDIYNCVKKIEDYNNKNTNYLKLKELDCNFKKDFDPNKYIINEPIILRGFYKNSIAYNKWNKDNLSEKFGKKKIQCESYNDYFSFLLNEVDNDKYLNMSEFLEKKDTEFLYIGEISINDFKKPSLYRDTHNPSIDIEPFDTVIFCGNPNAGSHTHIHLEPFDYILNQVIGTKTMYLFDLNDNIEQNLGISSPFNIHSRFIFDYNKFDTVNLRLIKHQKLKIYKVTLYPGDSIIIPPWWWHNGICNDFSLSITDKYERDPSFFYKYPYLFYNHTITTILKPKSMFKFLNYIHTNFLPIFDFDNIIESKKDRIYEQNVNTFCSIFYYILYISFFTIILFFILKNYNIRVPTYYLFFIIFFIDYFFIKNVGD
jgi:hypothetical protein